MTIHTRNRFMIRRVPISAHDHPMVEHNDQQACLVSVRGDPGDLMQLDPEGHETAALNRLLPDIRGLRVLEVGCGDGRLTCRYAERVGSVLAIDPDPAAIATFRDAIPSNLRRHVEMRTGTIATLGPPRRAFDVVLFAWSL